MFRTLVHYFFGILFIFAFSCRHAEKKYNIVVPLTAEWEFRVLGQKNWLPANIPGNIIADLIRNKIIENPFLSLDATKLAWIAKNDFEYRTKFDLDQDVLVQDSIQICFQELETYADIYLNDSLILKAGHNNPSPVINCKSNLKETDNDLRVYFHSSLKIQKRFKTDCNSKNDHTDLKLNSILCHETPINANGIYHPVSIRAWSIARIDGLYLHPKQINKKNAEYVAEFSIVSTINQKVTLELLVNNKPSQIPLTIELKKGYNRQHIMISIKDPKLWWTREVGDQNLYDVSVVIKKNQQVISQEHKRLGIRTIKLVQTEGSGKNPGFQLNGIPLFIKGTHYFPCQIYDDQSTAENCRQVIENAVTANVNMIRIHEGINCEDDLFYNLCDEQGILVWHDLGSLCPMQLTDTMSFENTSMTTIENIKRLCNHPCLTVFSDSVPHGQYIMNGCGIASLPSIRTIKMFVPAKDMQIPTQPMSESTNHNDGDYMLIFNHICNVYKPPKNYASFIYLSQLAQADAMKTAIESCRRHMQSCTGLFYWQLNDCKPSVSCSTIDYYGRYKLAHYAACDAFAHVLVIPVRENGFVKVYAVSDVLKELDATLLTKLIDFKGKSLYVKQIPVVLDANNVTLLLSVNESEILKNADKSTCCLIIQLNQPYKSLSSNILYFTDPKDLNLPKVIIQLDASKTAKGFTLVLKSEMLAKNVWIETNSRDSYCSDNNFDLLPDKKMKIDVRYQGTKEEFLKDLKIYTLADSY